MQPMPTATDSNKITTDALLSAKITSYLNGLQMHDVCAVYFDEDRPTSYELRTLRDICNQLADYSSLTSKQRGYLNVLAQKILGKTPAPEKPKTTDVGGDVALAVKTCELLEEYGSLKTPWLSKRLGLYNKADWSKHDAYRRNVLERLESLGVLRHSGNKVFVWQIVKSDWNRSNPFDVNGNGHVPKPSHDDSAEVAQLRQQLRDAQDAGRQIVEALQKQHADDVAKLRAEFAEQLKQAETQVKVVKIVRPDGKTKTLKDMPIPKTFPRVLALAAARRNILLVGPAGCGKTFLAKMTAESLGLKFGSVSCSAGMSEAALTGRAVPNLTDGTSVFVSTEFLDCYENGGVFLLDELDAADSNVLIALNSALANGYCNVPMRSEKPQAKRHKDFVCIATANTHGRGADRSYVGRGQLDEATLSRFRIGTVEVYYDEAVEAAVCPHDEIRGRLLSIRTKIEAARLRRFVDSRFLEDAYTMHVSAGWTLVEIEEALFSGWTSEEKAKAV